MWFKPWVYILVSGVKTWILWAKKVNIMAADALAPLYLTKSLAASILSVLCEHKICKLPQPQNIPTFLMHPWFVKLILASYLLPLGSQIYCGDGRWPLYKSQKLIYGVPVSGQRYFAAVAMIRCSPTISVVLMPPLGSPIGICIPLTLSGWICSQDFI